jgi:hypothetical protein
VDPERVRELPAVAFARTIKPLSSTQRQQNVVILGFDTEYDSNDQTIISYQLSDGLEECGDPGHDHPLGASHAVLAEADERWTWPILSEWTRQNLKVWGYRLRDCVTIALVSHFSTAELSQIQDFWREANVRRVSPQQVYNASYRYNKHCRIAVTDMYHFFQAGLATVCKTFGEEKKDYDTRFVHRDSLKDPVFYEYALWDAVVCARIFTKFRARVWDEYQVDIIRYPTPASTAMAIYRRHFLTQASDPVPGNVRRQAWLSLWGGRAEAYVQGDYKGDWTLSDVVSLYPSSAILLDDLPLGQHWYALEPDEEPQRWKGLCRVAFRFPKDTRMPCLPVYYDNRLLFTRSGVSDCTLSEVRTALALGAEIRFLKTFEYEKGDTSLHDYMLSFKARKQLAEDEGDKVGRWLAKLYMNALVGKFSQHRGDVDIEDLKQFAERVNVPVETVMDPRFHHPDKPKPQPRIGNSIMPEWSALILGHARAIMARHLADTDALVCSTDSALVPTDQVRLLDQRTSETGVQFSSKNENPGQRACKQCPETAPVTYVRVVRNRAYTGTCPHGRPIFSATHAIHLPKADDIAAMFLLSDEHKYKKRHNLGLKEAIRRGRPFFEQSEMPMTFKRAWDNKRLLHGEGDTEPWGSLRHYHRKVIRV